MQHNAFGKKRVKRRYSWTIYAFSPFVLYYVCMNVHHRTAIKIHLITINNIDGIDNINNGQNRWETNECITVRSVKSDVFFLLLINKKNPC